MNRWRPLLFVALSGLLLPHPAVGQAAAPAVEQLRRQYAATLGTAPQLYSGPEYVDYTRRYHKHTGDPFFLAPEPQAGTLAYNGQQFDSLRLRYDLVLDQVVLAVPNSPYMLRVVDEKMRGFTVGGHRFVRLVADSASASVIRTGYYEVLADGRAQLLARRTKQMQERLNQPFIDVEFYATNRILLQKEGRYYPVRGKAPVLRLLADRGPAVPQYLKEHRLKFNKASFEPSVTELVRYYNGRPPQ